MNSAPFEVRFAEPANIDFLGIMNRTVERLGHAAADRYQALIGQTLIDLADDPFRPGARQREDLAAGVYAYHLVSSRDRMAGDRVKAPRHFVIYRVSAPFVDVLRILHDSRDLSRHLPADDQAR